MPEGMRGLPLWQHPPSSEGLVQCNGDLPRLGLFGFGNRVSINLAKT